MSFRRDPAVVIMLAIAATLVIAMPTGARAGGSPVSYLLSAQNSDGGFGPAPGSSSSALYSGWAALGLASEGVNIATVEHGGQSLISYIESTESANTDPGSIERTILVLRAAGLPASGLVAALQHDIGSDGAVSGQVNLTSFGILALRAAGVSPPPNMSSWLIGQEDSDGGFNFATKGGSSDVDDTGAALEALAGSGGSVTSRAEAFINHQENGDGGFPSQPGGTSNAQSTAWAIQGLLASGVSSGSLSRPLGYLGSLIGPNGAIDYSKGTSQTPVWVTGEAMMALAGKSLPLAPPATGGTAGHHASAAHHAAAGRKSKPARPKHRRHHGHRRALRILHRFVVALGLADALALAPVG